jgi:acyl carrier protein
MALSEHDILGGLAELISTEMEIPAESISAEQSLTDDLKIDSLSMITIVYNAEERFGVRIPDDEANKLATVQDAVDYIKNNQAA